MKTQKIRQFVEGASYLKYDSIGVKSSDSFSKVKNFQVDRGEASRFISN